MSKTDDLGRSIIVDFNQMTEMGVSCGQAGDFITARRYLEEALTLSK